MSKKWTEDKVRERLWPALVELGRTWQSIARSLAAKGIKGSVDDSYYCPMATYIRKLFRSATRIAVTSGEPPCVVITFGEVGDPENTVIVDCPAAIGKFIEKFDELDEPTDPLLTVLVKK